MKGINVLSLFDGMSCGQIALEKVGVKVDNYFAGEIKLDCEPVRICGSLVSGALRDRLYWTNIPPFSYDLTGRLISNIPQPKDKLIMLQDVLDSGVVNKRKHSCLNTASGAGGKQEYLKHRNATTGMITLIQEQNEVRTVNQNELERLHNIPKNYTSILNQKKAGDLIGDGWTVDVAAHIFKNIKL